MNIWHDINPDRITPNDFMAVIEIEKGSKKKYELDKQTGLIVLGVPVEPSHRVNALRNVGQQVGSDLPAHLVRH